MHRASAGTGHLLRQRLGDASPDCAQWPHGLGFLLCEGSSVCLEG